MLAPSSADTEPPVPLILAGAAFSTSRAIRERWEELLSWAQANGLFDFLLENLPPAPGFDVAERIAGVSEDGRGWWPEYGNQFEAPKQKPPQELVVEKLAALQANWRGFGEDFWRNLAPIRITGRKRRRLLVRVNPEFRPPWGSWSSRSTCPSAFTAFRRKINEILSPIEIDEIDFTTSGWSR